MLKTEETIVRGITWTRKERDAFIKQWIKDLRSGEFQQGSQSLLRHDDTVDEFCCLGVACDLAVRNDFGDWQNTCFHIDIFQPQGYEDTATYDDGKLPEFFRELLGIEEQVEEKLINMNDEDEASFDNIAQYIEDNILPSVPLWWTGVVNGD